MRSVSWKCIRSEDREGRIKRKAAFMRAKTRAENEARGEVGGSAQMVSCQWPAVRVCGALIPYISVDARERGAHACPCSLVCTRACVRVPMPSEPVEKRRAACAQSCSTQMALASRHRKAGGVGTARPAHSWHRQPPCVPPVHGGESTCCQPPELID